MHLYRVLQEQVHVHDGTAIVLPEGFGQDGLVQGRASFTVEAESVLRQSVPTGSRITARRPRWHGVVGVGWQNEIQRRHGGVEEHVHLEKFRRLKFRSLTFRGLKKFRTLHFRRLCSLEVEADDKLSLVE